MELIESKSLLAKLMATENLTVEQRKVQTASFDVKNRILTLPILAQSLSSNLYDLFTGHEVGHALYTPLDGMMKAKEEKINMSVVNVVEDSRIERKIKYKYPGLKTPFFKAYGELIERNFFETEGKNLNEYNLIDRINLHCKVGAVLNIQFTDKEREFLDAVESTETYEEVIEVSKRIIEYMKMEKGEEIKQMVLTQVSQDDLDGELEEYDGEGQEINSDGEEQSDFDSTPSQNDEEESEQGDDKTKSSRMEKLLDDLLKERMEEYINAKTDEALHRNESQLFDPSNNEYLYVNIPEVDLNFVLDYKKLYEKFKEHAKDYYIEVNTKEYLKYRRESEKVVSYLVKEFELRKNADQLKRASTSKTGDLNMSKLFSYKFSEDIFKKVTVVPGGKSHGLIMFLDWSGSMTDHIANTVKQLTNLTLFCKKVNIPFEVYTFHEAPDAENRFKQKPKIGDLRLHNDFGLSNILSSRMSSSEMTYAYSALFSLAGIGSRPKPQPQWMHMSGTPLNEAIICSMKIIPEFQKKYKLQIVNTVFLTDGEGGRLSQKYEDEHSYSHIPSADRNTIVVMRDTVTKQERAFTNKYNSFNQTKALIELLKLRTNCNSVGFFVCGREFSQRIKDFNPKVINDYALFSELKNEFTKNKFLVVEDSGFDEYYILRSKGLDTDENNSFEVTAANPTTRGLVSAFNKYAGSRVNNRVILNRFINLIS